MCELNLVTLQCVTVKVLSIISNVFRVSHFADGPLGLVSQTPAHLEERRKACFEENTLVACLLHHYE